MITRYLSALSAGFLVTLAILFAMQGLIKLQPGAVYEGPVFEIHDWHNTKTRETPPPEPERVFEKEDLTRVIETPTGNPDRLTYDPSGLRIPTSTPGKVPQIPTGIDQPDGPLIAIVRVQPIYPQAAADRGLEGWVDVRFDVTTDGHAINIEVIGSSNRIFERAAIKAATRFRFKAPVVDGVSQPATGVEYRFRFDMET